MKYKIKNLLKLIVTFLIFFYASTILAYSLQLFGIDVKNLSNGIKAILEFGLSFTLMIVISLLYLKDIKHDLKEFKYNWPSKILYSLKLFLIFMGIKFAASYITSFLALSFGIELTTSENQTAINELLKDMPLLIVLTSVFLAPIYEELLFRLGIKKCIKNRVLFVFISGFIFGFIHVFPTDLNLGLAILQVIPYITMGICLAYYYQKYNNICYSILIHFYNNLFSIIILLLTMFVY